LRRYLATAAIYLAVVASAFGFNVIRSRAARNAATTPAREPIVASTKPYFSLTTNRSYSPNESARMWASYQNVEYLDFRVYRVKDPSKFFKQLDDPHQMGEKEKEEVAQGYGARVSILERTHRLKMSLFSAVRDYVRTHLLKEHRETFNQKFRKEPEPERTPLNVATDYARVPLLNPDQKVKDWREKLPPLENDYDSRVVSLGRVDPGVYLIEAVNGDLRAYSIAIVTNLTMIEKTTKDGQVLVYVVDRKSGAPHEHVSVEITKAKQTLATGSTDKTGIFKTEIKPPQADQTAPEDADPESQTNNAYLIMAKEGDNFVISDVESFYFGQEAGGDDVLSGEDLTSYIYTDRPIYRPTHKVYFKGILRKWGRNGYELLGDKTVNVTVDDPNNGKVFEKELPLSTRGTFSGDLDIAEEAPLGSYTITAAVGEAKATGYFQVDEYKKPEFKVKVTGPKDFAAVGEKVKFGIGANYFFGAPVTNADVHYYIYKQRYYHWWWGDESSDEFDDAAGPENEGDDENDEGYYGSDLVTEGDAQINSKGEATVEFQVPAPEEKDEWDYSYRLEAQVTDASRREMKGSASFIGTRGKTVADAYPERYLYYQGDAAKIRIKTADYSGKPVSEKVTLKFVEQKYEKVEKDEENNGYKYKTTDYILHERELASAEVNTDSQGNANYDFTVPSPGSIYVKAIVNEDGKQIVNRGGSFWAPDKKGEWSDFEYRDFDAKSIKLVPDKKSYKAGETAHVLVMLPADKAHLLVTTELSEVMTARQLDATGRSIVIDVPIEHKYEPNVYLDVSFVKDSDMYNQSQLIAVPARDKMLKLDIVPNKKEFKPRDVASYTILARNEDGSPAANAEVSLGIIDEAIYSVQSETAANIKREFYGKRYDSVQTSLAIHYTFTGYAGDKPANLAKNKSSYQLADFKNDSSYAEPTIRREFKDTAFWQPDVVTGGDGKATVSFKMPDNLTTWRATARAVTADTRVGSAVQKTIARKDVIMRLEMPRFLTEGDTVTISGVVHNFLKSDKSTKISLDLHGAQLLDAANSTVTIRQNGEQRVDWRVRADQVGKLTLLAKALTDTESDAVEMSMDIVPHGLKSTLGNTATLTQNDTEQTIALDIPVNPNTQARIMRIEASGSIAATLFGALDYLTSFPYGCTEQTMSSFLPNVIVAQTLKDVPSAKLRAANDLDKKMQRGMDRLYAYQHDDGGWGWWKDDKTDPFMTAYVVDGLTMAQRAGYQIDTARRDQGREKLSALLTAGKRDDGNPIDDETRAYMIYALTESGDSDGHYLEDLYGKRGGLGPYGRALLALALQQRKDGRAKEVANTIAGAAQKDEFEAHWQTARVNDYGGDVYLDVEATALSLKALAQIDPNNALLPKAARWLVKNRRNGYYWLSTKETAFAIYGLTDYLKVSHELSPDYSFEIYLNGTQVANQHVGPGDATNAQALVITKKAGEVSNNNQIRIVKHGRGALYVSTALEYFTADENVAAQSTPSLKLTREYLRLRVSENEGGKASWKIEPFSGELRSGDLIVVRLHLTGARAQYVMIEDPIPAGAEQVAQVSGISLNHTNGQWSDWYSNREFRDSRTVIFQNYFDGDATFQYAMRVEVPGEFRVAPARAELMYQPTVQANTSNDRLRILDKK
jgi:uncharacterized protein YfaS (alpha-2-macroglobulin family)